MHKLDLNSAEDTSSSTETTFSQEPVASTQTPVDSTPVWNDNQRSSTSYRSSPAENSMKTNAKKSLIIASIIAISAGVLTGFGGFKLMAKSQGIPVGGTMQQVAGETIKKGEVFGSPDKDAFKDSAEGFLEKGGIEGEGSHHLLRPGGEAQTVYLTSSVTDLDKLDGAQIKVWGETFKGQKAGWLMDVGRVEVIEPKGEKPVEE